MNRAVTHLNWKRLCVAGFAVCAMGTLLIAEPTGNSDPKLHGRLQDCGLCHTCDNPTSENLCLNSCSREDTKAFRETLIRQDEPQGIILLDMLKGSSEGEDRLGPVPFDHSGHARMAAMSGDCQSCHHFTEEGAQHPACRTCHTAELQRDDISKPSLKGAYHRQCMGCHREWAHETDCRECHIPQVGEDQPVELKMPTYMAVKHPPIPEPEVETYLAEYKPGVHSTVIFRHREHTERFGFQCVECHKGDSCARCHDQQRERIEKTFDEYHQICSRCHEADVKSRCDRCHWDGDGGMPKRFDHSDTGWVLSKYHQDESCRSCHAPVPFGKLDTACKSCHADWDSQTFDHTLTGQALNETHAPFECTDCHIDHAYEAPPACSECHDEDEGIQFPRQRPGPLLTSGR